MENRLHLKNVRHTFIVLVIVLLETTHCQRILENMERFCLSRSSNYENGYGMDMKLQQLEANMQELTKSLRESRTETQILSRKLEYFIAIQSRSEIATTRQVTQTETAEEIVNRRIGMLDDRLNALEIKTTNLISNLVDKMEQTADSSNGTMDRLDKLENTVQEIVNRRLDHKLNELENYTECMFADGYSRLYDLEKKISEIEFDTCMSKIDNSSKGLVKFNEPKSENGSRKGVYGRSDGITVKCDKSRPDSLYGRIERMEELQEDHASHINQSYQELASLHSELLNNKANIYDTIDELADIGRKLNNLATKPGGTYVRWGRTSCPSATATLVYTGFTAGKKYNFYGSGTNILCLHDNPISGRYTWGTQIERAQIYGGQIGKRTWARSLPCAVCRTKTSGTTLMVPGRNICMTGWNREYSGRLMSSQDNEYGATEYICMDSNPDRGHSNQNQHFRLFDVEARCGTLKCPPYVNGQEITCAVCSSQT